jgi:hypothetical protein
MAIASKAVVTVVNRVAAMAVSRVATAEVSKVAMVEVSKVATEAHKVVNRPAASGVKDNRPLATEHRA